MYTSTFIIIAASFFLMCSDGNVLISNPQRMKSNCNTADDFAPCVCRVQLTGTVIHQNNRWIAIEFLESVCSVEENHRREREGQIYEDYYCYQVRQQSAVHQDVFGNPIDVIVSRRMGCELRCVAKNCGKEDKDVVTKKLVDQI